MFERAVTTCFSGNRSYTGDPESEARLRELFQEACAAGYRNFISGMAEGFDLYAAEAVLEMKTSHPDIQLISAVPFPQQSAHFSDQDRSRYRRILESADKVITLEKRHSAGCFYRRNEWMVEHSSRLICWYDGSKSGTRHTVLLSLNEGLDVFNAYRPESSLF